MTKHGLRHKFNNLLDRSKHKLSDYNAHEIEPWIWQPYQKGDY